MGFKVTFGSKGAVTTRIGGSDTVQFDSVARKTVTVVSESGNVTITTATTLVRPMNAAGVTASLPTISDDIVGNEYLIFKNSGSNPLLLSGVNPILGTPFTAVGAWSCALSASAGNYTAFAISGSTGYHWVIGGRGF